MKGDEKSWYTSFSILELKKKDFLYNLFIL